MEFKVEHDCLTILTGRGTFHFFCKKEELVTLGKLLFNEYGCIDWT